MNDDSPVAFVDNVDTGTANGMTGLSVAVSSSDNMTGASASPPIPLLPETVSLLPSAQLLQIRTQQSCLQSKDRSQPQSLSSFHTDGSELNQESLASVPQEVSVAKAAAAAGFSLTCDFEGGSSDSDTETDNNSDIHCSANNTVTNNKTTSTTTTTKTPTVTIKLNLECDLGSSSDDTASDLDLLSPVMGLAPPPPANPPPQLSPLLASAPPVLREYDLSSFPTSSDDDSVKDAMRNFSPTIVRQMNNREEIVLLESSSEEGIDDDNFFWVDGSTSPAPAPAPAPTPAPAPAPAPARVTEKKKSKLSAKKRKNNMTIFNHNSAEIIPLSKKSRNFHGKKTTAPAPPLTKKKMGQAHNKLQSLPRPIFSHRPKVGALPRKVEGKKNWSSDEDGGDSANFNHYNEYDTEGSLNKGTKRDGDSIAARKISSLSSLSSLSHRTTIDGNICIDRNNNFDCDYGDDDDYNKVQVSFSDDEYNVEVKGTTNNTARGKKSGNGKGNRGGNYRSKGKWGGKGNGNRKRSSNQNSQGKNDRSNGSHYDDWGYSKRNQRTNF